MNRSLLLLIAAGLALRLGMAAYTAPTPLVADEANYAAIAVSMAERGEFGFDGKPTALRTPLYPAFLYPFARWSAHPWTHARLAQSFLDASTIFLLYLIALRTLRNKKAALLGAGLYALHPIFIAYSAHILTEPLFFWVWALAILLLIKALDSTATKTDVVLAGIALGLPTLCRPNFMLFPIAVAVMFPLFYFRNPTILKKIGAIVVLSFLTIFPWMVRNRVVLGSWAIATQVGTALWVGTQVPFPHDAQAISDRLAQTMGPFEVEQEFRRMAKDELRKNWPKIVLDLPNRFLHFWLTSHSAMFGIDEPLSVYRRDGRWGAIFIRGILWLLHFTVLAGGLWGIWAMRNSWTLGATAAVTALAYYNQHIFLSYWGNRYHLPAIMLLLPFAAATALRLTGQTQEDS